MKDKLVNGWHRGTDGDDRESQSQHSRHPWLPEHLKIIQVAIPRQKRATQVQKECRVLWIPGGFSGARFLPNPTCPPSRCLCLYSPPPSCLQPASHTQPAQPTPSSSHPSIPAVLFPVYLGALFYFHFPGKSMHPTVSPPCHLASLGLWFVGWLSYKLYY